MWLHKWIVHCRLTYFVIQTIYSKTNTEQKIQSHFLGFPGVYSFICWRYVTRTVQCYLSSLGLTSLCVTCHRKQLHSNQNILLALTKWNNVTQLSVYSYYHQNFYSLWKASLLTSSFKLITSKRSANGVKYRTFTIFTIPIHRPQLYIICCVSVHLHTKFHVLQSTGHYLSHYCKTANYMNRMVLRHPLGPSKHFFKRGNMRYSYGTELKDTQQLHEIKNASGS